MENTMNTKQLKKQMLAAIAMLLVAALALGTATYAWFVSNRQVEASGMKVKAQSEDGLLIANAKKAPWATSASSATTDLQLLKPTSTLDGSVWMKASATDTSTSTAQEGTYEVLKDKTGYVVEHQFYIKGATPEAFDVKALNVKQVTVTGNTSKLSNAVRVGVKLNDGTMLVYAPVGTHQNYPVHTSETATDTVTLSPIASETATGVTNIPAMGAQDSELISAVIYIWFEGEDAETYTDNYLEKEADALDVSVLFNYTPAE